MGALPEEQMAMRKGSMGCLDALAVYTMIGQETKASKGEQPGSLLDKLPEIL